MSGTGSGGVSYTSQDVWSDGTYNAFTDLTRFQGNWYLVFAASSGQSVPAIGQPGRIRVLESADFQSWTSVAVLSSSGDLRDPKITVTPSNQLMIISGDVSQIAPYVVQSAAWFSSNGTNWGNENPTGVADSWIWRTVWHDGVGYGIAYGPNNTDPTGGSEQTTWLLTTTNGLNYSAALQLSPTGQMADEAGLAFLPNGTAVMVTRRDWETTSSVGISTAASNYTNWTFTNANLQLESPNLLTLPDGRIVAAGRMYAQPNVAYTGLAWVDPTTGTLTPFLKFANTYGTDTGYPGLYWYNNQLMVSYYSTNPTGPGADIFVAQVTIPSSGPTSFWTAAGGDWSAAANWTNGAPNVVGAAAVIDAPISSPVTVVLDNAQTVGSLVLGSGAAGVGYTLSGSGSNTLTLSNSGNGVTITLNDGNHVIAAPVILADNLMVTGSGTLAFGIFGSITETNGSHRLTMNGAGGILILSGSDSYTGGTTVNQGVLTFLNKVSQPVSGTTTVAAGATLGLGVGPTSTYFGAADLDALFAGTMPAVSNDPNSNVGIDTTAGSFTYASNISGAKGLVKLGPNSLILTGVNTYSGGTTVNGGTLQASGAGTFGATSGPLTVNAGLFDLCGMSRGVGNLVGSGGTIGNNGSGTTILSVGNGNGTGGSYAGVIADHTTGSGTLALIKTGSGTITLSAASTFTGGTTINGGVLRLNAAGLTYDAGALSGTINVNPGATLDVGQDWNVSSDNTLDLDGGTLNFSVTDEGNFVNTVSGTNAAISGSAFRTGYFGNSIFAFSGTNTISANMTLANYHTGASTDTFTVLLPDPSDTLTVSGQIRDLPGSIGMPLIKGGNGTLVLTGSNTYMGGTDVTDGTLCATNPNALPEGSSLTVGAGAALLFSSPAAALPTTNPWPDGQVAGSVPEPGTVGLIVAGLATAFALRRCK